VSHFLLIYDRLAGELVRQTEFNEAVEALNARFAAEKEFAGRVDIEIVSFAADSEDDLRRTHARYFLGLDELAARMAR
jgi:hypothetical protein